MSRIYFDALDGNAELRGSERAYAGMTTTNLLVQALRLDSSMFFEDSPAKPNPIRTIVSKNSYIASMNLYGVQYARTLTTAIQGLGVDFVFPDHNKGISSFTIALNTALVAGSDQVKLLARLHRQCEIHAWIDGPNRAWIADIIKQGLSSGIFRAGQQWEDVEALLRNNNQNPVVTSYSVTDSFLSEAQSTLGISEKAWNRLSEKKQWEKGMEFVRSDPWLEIKPDNWSDYYFGSGINGYMISEYLYNNGPNPATLERP